MSHDRNISTKKIFRSSQGNYSRCAKCVINISPVALESSLLAILLGSFSLSILKYIYTTLGEFEWQMMTLV